MSEEQDKLKLSLEPPKLFGRKRKATAEPAAPASKRRPARPSQSSAETVDPDRAVQDDEPATRPVAVDEPEPAAAEVAPTAAEPEPEPAEAQPAEEPAAQDTPTAEPAAEVVESPPETETQPVPSEPEPVVPETEPVPVVPETEPEPVVPETEPKPVAPETEPQPVVPEPEPQPAVPETEPEPVVPETEPEPDVPEPGPAVPETEPEQTEPAPVIEPVESSGPEQAGEEPTPARRSRTRTAARKQVSMAGAIEPEPVSDADLEDAEIEALAARSEPLLGAYRAAALTGLVVGAVMVVLTWLSLRGCEAIRGTSTCGGGPQGFIILVVIFALCVLLGSALLRVFGVPDPPSTSFLAVGIVAVIALLFFVDLLDSWTMLIIVPILAIGGYLASVWVTQTFVESDDT